MYSLKYKNSEKIMDATYTIAPVNLRGTEYDVFCDSQLVARFKKPTFTLKDKCSLVMSEKEYYFYREGILSGDWILEEIHDGKVAVAKKSFFVDDFEIQSCNGTFQLKSKKFSLTDRFVIYENESHMGTINKLSLFSRKLQCTAFDTVPIEIILFMMYLAMIIIDRRSAQ